MNGMTNSFQQQYQLQNDYDAFPALQPASQEQWLGVQQRRYPVEYSGQNSYYLSPSPGFKNRNAAFNQSSRPNSRPNSRHQHQQHHHELNPAAPSVDDPEAFPTLASLSARVTARKQYGKRGGSGNNRNGAGKDNSPAALAEPSRTTSSPTINQRKNNGKPTNNRPSTGNREISPAVLAIAAPKHVPWLETGDRENKSYMKYRLDAITHGHVRNKFLHR